MPYKNLILLSAIIILGVFLRFQNISPFKFYPDSYQTLLVSENIKNYQSVLGFLGEGGIIYPPFFMWTRPVYPILINLTQNFFGNQLIASQFIPIFLGSLTIPLVFLYIKNIFSSKLLGLIGAFLLATSFNHTIWGGFIYTETTGIFFMILSLSLIFKNLTKPKKLADFYDLLSGCTFSLTIFSRYEYLIVFFPILFLIWQKSPTPKIQLINIISSLALVSSLFLSFLYPTQQLKNIVISQLRPFTNLFSFIAVAFIAVFLIRVKNLIPKTLNLAFICIILFALSLLLPINQLTGIRNFFSSDILLGVLTLIGFIYLLKNNNLNTYAIFALISIIVLSPIYYKVNPLMQRYWTHMIPFLLIPASYGGLKLLKSKFSLILIPLVAYQIFLTFNGIKAWDNGSYLRTSYEEKAAIEVSKKVTDQESILLVSEPEPYFYFSRLSTQSILETDQPPFLNIESEESNNIYIVQDMGMHHIFPNFSRFLDENLQDKKILEFWINETFHYTYKSYKEEKPVVLYKISLSELKMRIQNSNLANQ